MIIGIAGRGSSGKSTVAQILTKNHRYQEIAFADEIKRTARRWWPNFTIDELWGPSHLRETVHPEYGGLTPRRACQYLGTEIGRALDRNVWVRIGINAAQTILRGGWDYAPHIGLIEAPSYREPYRGVAFSDCRFPNEGDAIHEAGGIVWKTQHGVGLSGEAGAHESERHIDSLEVDALVPHGPLSEVPAVVADLLAKSRGER